MEGRRMRASSAASILFPLLLAAIVPYKATIALAEGTFPVAKRMNIETCLVRFDVHLNTIIRTEESRSMGACFLDDADLNTREQCLRLCCETENCDVFVFEEKSPGTCFLFQCGPPENFRCKFTHHSNYTSAVLSLPAMEQQPPPLAPPLAAQIQSLSAQQQQQPAGGGKKHLSQHELELVNLKETGSGKQQVAALGLNFGPTSTTSLPPLGVRLGDTLSTPSVGTPKQQPSASVQQCGHFEFPCHSGECIAVYNVCDGIPQCEDSSDEGADCPQKNSQGPAAPGGAANQPSGAMMAPGGGGQPGGMLGGAKIKLPMYHPVDYQQTANRFIIDADQQLMQQQQQQQQLAKPMLMHRNREDPMTAPKPWPRAGINELNYVDSPDSRIFSHKGGLQLLAVNNMGSLPAQQYQESLPESNYMPARGGQSYLSLPGGNPYPQQVPQQQMSANQQQQQQPQYKSAVAPQQWVGGNSMRASWPLHSTTDRLPGMGVGAPREQYIQPPIQQRGPTGGALMQEMQQQPSSDVATAVGDPLTGPSLQQKPSLLQMQQQWPVEGQTQQEVSLPEPSTPSSRSTVDGAAGSESLGKDASNGAAGGQGSVSGAGEKQNEAKHKVSAAVRDSHDSETEYEDNAYDENYPDSTNAAGEAEEPTQTEPPKRKAHKHHKHDHGQDGQSPNPSSTNPEHPEEKQKKKKKSKSTKKDKAGDHHHGSSSADGIVHEHQKAALHKDLEIEFTDHDGYADRPGGAMLSLTLGVLLTAAMGILLSCRMRVARRRIRRPGKSSYAHDADFLVNGMYL